jgi:hypothetical protein
LGWGGRKEYDCNGLDECERCDGYVVGNEDDGKLGDAEDRFRASMRGEESNAEGVA